jgi:CubicO group peptidase (beta-lactamase class C family)
MSPDSAPLPSIDGTFDPRFAPLRAVMDDIFAKHGEVGAAVAVYLDGKPVVDLWGGRMVKNQKPAGPWQRDTIVRMMSVNKGVTAICAHRLADQGLLDYDKPVAFYWPEFAQAGKEAITVRHLMSGLAALIYPDEVPAGKAFDWDAMVTGLARQAPAWPVGTQGAYHSSTYGHLAGEIIRRITGKTPGVYFRDEIGGPLGLDYWFAVPKTEQHRVSEVLPNAGSVTYTQQAQGSATKLGRAWRILPNLDPGARDAPENLDKEMPSAAGRGNARAIGKLFAALSVGGTLDGVKVLSPAAIKTMTTLQWDGICGMTDRRFRYAMGLFLNTPVYAPMGPNPNTFGHPGAGGAIGIADPDRRMAFSYCTSFMCAGAGIGDRCQALIDATYASL